VPAIGLSIWQYSFSGGVVHFDQYFVTAKALSPAEPQPNDKQIFHHEVCHELTHARKELK
jgi:hypothetical protein